jgi:hypothetical protein
MLKRLFLCTLLTLAVSACAPSGKEGKDDPSNAPFGYEFAFAEAGGNARSSSYP